jgi:hypothetical protein
MHTGLLFKEIVMIAQQKAEARHILQVSLEGQRYKAAASVKPADPKDPKLMILLPTLEVMNSTIILFSRWVIM